MPHRNFATFAISTAPGALLRHDLDVVPDVLRLGGADPPCGVAGQAGAMRMALARSLAEVEPENRSTLKKAGLLTRDPRKKEKEEQFELVEAFFAKLRSLKRGVNEYATPSDFRALLRQQLEEILYLRLRPLVSLAEPPPAAAEVPAAREDQGEAVAWVDGGYVTVSEGSGRISFVAR